MFKLDFVLELQLDSYANPNGANGRIRKYNIIGILPKFAEEISFNKSNSGDSSNSNK